MNNNVNLITCLLLCLFSESMDFENHFPSSPSEAEQKASAFLQSSEDESVNDTFPRHKQSTNRKLIHYFDSRLTVSLIS